MSNVNQKALSALKTLSNVEEYAPLLASVASLPKAERPVELASLGTLLNAKVKKALALVPAINTLVNEQGMDSAMVGTFVATSETFVNVMTEAKMGSLNFSQYSVSALSSGLRVSQLGAKKGLVVNLDNNYAIKFKKTEYVSQYISYKSLNTDTYNSVMDRIVVISNNQGVWEEVVFTDFLLKLTLVQHYGIVLDSLLMNPNFILVLQYNDVLGKLCVFPHPMEDESVRPLLESIIGINASTYTAPSKALEGYVEVDANLKGIAQEGTDGNLYSFLGAKKLVARQEKLNGDTAVARIKARVFLVTKSGEVSKTIFNTGCFYSSHKLLMATGACRFTSDINNLLIKGVSHYAPWIAGDLGQTVSICASSSAKGGIASLMANLGQGFEFETMSEVPSVNVETITLLNGDVVEGVYADVVLKITNAYTAEMFTRYTEESSVSSLEEAQAIRVAESVDKVLTFNKKDTKALSMEVMQNCRKYSANIVDTLCIMEEQKLVSLKPAVTTLTQGEFENIALSFGDQVALAYMDSVINNRFNETVDMVTKAASEWLKASPKATAVEMSYDDLRSVFTEVVGKHGISVEDNIVSSLNTMFLREFIVEAGLSSENLGWIYVPELDVYIPTGEALYKGLFKTSNDFELEFEMPTALKYVMSTLFYFDKVEVAGNMTSAVLLSAGSKLHFFIQDSLLNKKVSKMKVHGKYMTLLPGYWLENVSDVCLLSRDMYQPKLSHMKWTKVNIAKHPVLFLQAVAGFRCFNEIPGIEVSEDLRAVYANTIFVHPDYLLQLQNDCDGDLARVSFDSYWLPLYTGAVMQGCMSAFHQDYIDGENDLGVSVNKLPKHEVFSYADLYTAIKEASDAKMNVALFTDNLHKLMASYRSSIITEKLCNKFGDEEGMAIVKDAISVVASMVQTDAMNAIKHSGGVTAGASLCSVEIGKEGGYVIAKEAMVDYLKTYNVNCKLESVEFAAVVASLAYYTHSLTVNNGEMLTNQYERLVFKNQPNELFKYIDFEGKEQVGSRRCNFFGMFKDTWNVTGKDSMFSEYLVRFYGREM